MLTILTTVAALGFAARLANPPRMMAGTTAEAVAATSTVPAVAATVQFVVGDGTSPFGTTSPEPAPTWLTVATHLSTRLPGFDARLAASVLTEDELLASSAPRADLIVGLGLSARSARTLGLASQRASALICYDCAPETQTLSFVGAYTPSATGLDAAVQTAQAAVAPWAAVARGQRLSAQADLLLSRHSSEDLLYALFFILHECAPRRAAREAAPRAPAAVMP